MPAPKNKLGYLCPCCGQSWTYSGTDYQFAIQDGCCHECAEEPPFKKPVVIDPSEGALE